MEYNDERRVYELGYHMVPTLTEEEVLNEVNALRVAIEESDGKVISEGEPERIDLAYTFVIGEGGRNTKYDTSFFGWIKFEFDPKQLSVFEEEFVKHNKNIMRYLLIKTVAEDTLANINLAELREIKNDDIITQVPDEEDVNISESDDNKKSGTDELDKDIDETIDKLLEK